jgi:hypothetical protein
VLPSTGRRDPDLVPATPARRRPVAPPPPPPAGGWRDPASRSGRPHWSGRVPAAASGARRRAARRSWSETPPRCPAARGHRRAAPARRRRHWAPAGPARWRCRAGPRCASPARPGPGSGRGRRGPRTLGYSPGRCGSPAPSRRQWWPSRPGPGCSVRMEAACRPRRARQARSAASPRSLSGPMSCACWCPRRVRQRYRHRSDRRRRRPEGSHPAHDQAPRLGITTRLGFRAGLPSCRPAHQPLRQPVW